MFEADLLWFVKFDLRKRLKKKPCNGTLRLTEEWLKGFYDDWEPENLKFFTVQNIHCDCQLVTGKPHPRGLLGLWSKACNFVTSL